MVKGLEQIISEPHAWVVRPLYGWNGF